MNNRTSDLKCWTPLQRLVLLVVLSLAAIQAARPALQYQQLKSFGFAERCTGRPIGRPIEGRDGRLYGTTTGGYNGVGAVVALTKDGHYTLLHSFSISGDEGRNPEATLVQGSDGALYGTTSSGGLTNLDNPYGGGTVFKLNKDGSGFTVLHRFSGYHAGDGSAPQGALLEASDGALYGTTRNGGTNDGGTVFKFNKDGSGYAVVRHFYSESGLYLYPKALLEGYDGLLYGLTEAGPAVFKLNKDGSGFIILRVFTSGDGGGVYPSELLEGIDGALYGATSASSKDGGLSVGGGTIFKLNKNGSNYTVLRGLSGNDGVGPNGLVQASDEVLYGTTSGSFRIDYNLASGGGTVFRLHPDGSGFALLHRFERTDDRSTGLVLGQDGAAYGITTGGGTAGSGSVFKLQKDGGGYTVLFSFSETGGDGANPSGALVESRDGTLYGVTITGGGNGAGTVFKLNKDGSDYTLSHSFSKPGGGSFPAAALIQGSDQRLYGTTSYGGDNNAGTAFSLNKDGSGFVVLHSFGSDDSDGTFPLGALIEASTGGLYGTTLQGGGNQPVGTIFKLNKDGSDYKVLHSFEPNHDGYSPEAGLVEGSDGALYGTAVYGGSEGAGTIFKLNKDGFGYTVLRNLSRNGANGAEHPTVLMEGSDGALYGTSQGASTNTVFRLNKDGSGFTVLHTFGSAAEDGRSQSIPSGLVEGRDGALYGLTGYGGTRTDRYGELAGTIFKLNKDGSGYAVLKSFPATVGAGEHPGAAVIQGSDGAFYGTTPAGGSMGFGTVFRFWPPETPANLRVAIVANTTQVSCTGESGSQYQLLRSTNLTTWTVFDWFVMPLCGAYTKVDKTSASAQAYYRGKWLP